MHIATHTSMGPSIKVIPPDQILQGLLNASIDDCDCNDSREQQSNRIRQFHSLQNVQVAIQSLHETLDAMNYEVVEVQNLLSQRDVLYHQLDHLRAERQQIEDEIENQEFTIQKTVKIRASRGLKELNDRLRRRINEVKDYIEKMDNQNFKIQQSMSVTSNIFPSYPRRNVHTYTQYRGPASPSWMDKMTVDQRTHTKFNRNYFDDFRKRLQVKQDQAWERVRRQQEEIDSRNARSLMNFNKVGMRSNYLSPKYRAS